MDTTFLISVFLGLAGGVGVSSLLIYRLAESRWNKHPMARCTSARAASFASSY